MSPTKRTLLGIALFLPLAATLLFTFACLPVPIGDPDKAKLDDRLTGAWRGIPKDPTDTSVALAVLRPWDTHTWYVQYLEYGQKDNPDKTQILNYKAWLADIGGIPFIVCENLDDKNFLIPGGGDPDKPDRYYFIARLDIQPDAIAVRPLVDNFEPLKDIKNRDKAEEIIKANLDNDKMYGDTLNFKKLTKDQLDLLDDARKKANIGLH